MNIGERDYVKVTGEGAKQQPGVLKVVAIHGHRLGHDWVRVAECLLPPYENRSRFENWPLSQLEKVPPPADK